MQNCYKSIFDFKITFLDYPEFEKDSYPALNYSYTIDLQKLTLKKADYKKSDNPPILHRKETFVAEVIEVQAAPFVDFSH